MKNHNLILQHHLFQIRKEKSTEIRSFKSSLFAAAQLSKGEKKHYLVISPRLPSDLLILQNKHCFAGGRGFSGRDIPSHSHCTQSGQKMNLYNTNILQCNNIHI